MDKPNPWAVALPLLKAEGLSEGTARRYVGLMASRYGAGRVLRAFECAKAKEPVPVDLRAWIRAYCESDAKTADWARDNTACEAKARELGIQARPGQSWSDLRKAIRERM